MDALGYETGGRDCDHCRFWERHDEGHDGGTDTIGFCRRFPPALERARHSSFGGGGPAGGASVKAIMGRWPLTLYSDWCGEHQPKLPDATDGGGDGETH